MVWKETRSLVRNFLIRVTCVLALFLIFPTPGQGQENTSDEYTRELVRLLTGLQKNPWAGWKAGTQVTIRYLVDLDAAGKPLGYEQPDLVFRVAEDEQSFEVTQSVKGKRTAFLVKNEPGLDTAQRTLSGVEPKPDVLEIDGVKLPCLLTEITFWELNGGNTMVTKEWVLASHPTVVVRKEGSGGRWRVSSARVTKSIGDEKFSCVELKKWLRFYSDGPAEALTTQYLCPDVPGHLVEEVKAFFKIKKGQRSSSPFQVIHQKVVEIKTAPVKIIVLGSAWRLCVR